MKKIILSSLAVLTLTGCISLKDDTPPPTLFLVNAQYNSQEQKTELPYAITVDKPKVVSGLNTDRIALVKDDGRVLDYFAEARWNGRLENIFQDFIIETLENQFRIVSISDSVVDQKADYKILTNIRDFQAEYEDGNLNKTPILKLSMAVSILRLRDNEILARYNIHEQQASKSNTLTDVTHGLEELAQKAFMDVNKNLSQTLK